VYFINDHLLKTTVMEVRLNKMLSDAGLCSRREADEYIKEGRVRVNDDLPRVGQKVTENDKVTLDDVNVTISKKSLRDAEAAKLPKVRNDVKKESAAGEGRTSGTRPEKKGGLRPGKYGKYNKYAAARARARAHENTDNEETAEPRRTRSSRPQRSFEGRSERSSFNNSADERPQRNRTFGGQRSEGRPQSRPQRSSGRNNRTRGDR
jgi:ribosomal 50S subunit-recycling heat shock protein